MLAKITATFFVCIVLSTGAIAQEEAKKEEKPVKGYGFKIEKKIECTDVNHKTIPEPAGALAGASFLESELIRRGKGKHNISEMFLVKNVYKDKAMNYVLRSGKANFGQGALAHDFITRLIGMD